MSRPQGSFGGIGHKTRPPRRPQLGSKGCPAHARRRLRDQGSFCILWPRSPSPSRRTQDAGARSAGFRGIDEADVFCCCCASFLGLHNRWTLLHRETIRFAMHPMQGLLYQRRGFAKLGCCCCGADAANNTQENDRKTIKHAKRRGGKSDGKGRGFEILGQTGYGELQPFFERSWQPGTLRVLPLTAARCMPAALQLHAPLTLN